MVCQERQKEGRARRSSNLSARGEKAQILNDDVERIDRYFISETGEREMPRTRAISAMPSLPVTSSKSVRVNKELALTVYPG